MSRGKDGKYYVPMASFSEMGFFSKIFVLIAYGIGAIIVLFILLAIFS